MSSRPVGFLRGWLISGQHIQDYTAWQYASTSADDQPPFTLQDASGGTTAIVDAGGIASAEAFGADTFASHVSVAGAGAIASSEAFGADTFSSRVAVVGAGGIVSSEAFGQPTVTAIGAASPSQFGGWPPRLHKFETYTPLVVPKWVKVRGAGGIESGEAFGLLRVTSRRAARVRRREEELLAA